MHVVNSFNYTNSCYIAVLNVEYIDSRQSTSWTVAELGRETGWAPPPPKTNSIPASFWSITSGQINWPQPYTLFICELQLLDSSRMQMYFPSTPLPSSNCLLLLRRTWWDDVKEDAKCFVLPEMMMRRSGTEIERQWQLANPCMPILSFILPEGDKRTRGKEI